MSPFEHSAAEHCAQAAEIGRKISPERPWLGQIGALEETLRDQILRAELAEEQLERAKDRVRQLELWLREGAA